jgi:hypothetical protein
MSTAKGHEMPTTEHIEYPEVATVQEAELWHAFVVAHAKAESTKSLTDGIAAGKALGRFHALYCSSGLGQPANDNDRRD